ncbi:MAG: hypothetical protein ACLRFL_02215 [Clostridia bacterium]
MKKEINKENKEKPKLKTKKLWLWPIIVLVLAFVLSFSFSILSEVALNNASIIIAVIVIFVFVILSILFDMVGLAVASCSLEPFTAMAARKVKGSKQAISLIKNADKVSSVCNDVIGDICGILSGAAGATIVAQIAIASNGGMVEVLIASLVSAIIAALTIWGKASFKRLAINHCTGITLGLAKVINFFTRKD